MANPDGGTGFPGQIQVRDAVSNAPIDLYGDETAGALNVVMWVWDTDALSWSKMTQPSLESDYYKDQRFDYTSGNLDYKGVNVTHKAATAAVTWEIWKYTWVSSNLVRIEGPLAGAWDDRAALDWG